MAVIYFNRDLMAHVIDSRRARVAELIGRSK